MPTLKEFQLIKEKNLSHEVLLQNLEYDPITGIFTRKNCHISALNGKPAGYLNQDCGYVRVKVKNILHAAHRLAWFYTHGTWPIGDLDHEDRDKSNNAIKNLRPATEEQNAYNVDRSKSNNSGCVGVYWYKPRNCWRVVAKERGVRKYLGHFKDFNDAVLARETYTKQLHKEFYCQLSNSLAPLSPSLG